MRRKIPATQALLCFDAAARHESFTRAAQELSLTQSAVSRQITTLEELVGMALFRRTRHGVALTRAGTRYAAQVAARLRELEHDTLDLMSTQGQGGTVQLASVPTFAARWLVPRLPDFHAQHANTVVHMETRTRPFLFNDTPFDAAIFSGTELQIRHWAGTCCHPLMPEHVVAVCSPALLQGRKALRVQEVARLPLLQQSTRPDSWQSWFSAQGVEAPNAFAGPRYEQFSMATSAAACGMGIALVPQLLIEAELARGELVLAHPAPLPGERHYYLVLPDTTDTSPAVEQFSEWLQAVCKADAPLRTI
ncbi:MAG: LysR family transcriptional regulator [Rhodoferax sp.]|nr:LysR family transcriptional regulator [Rhodoferax sp.]